VVRGADAVARQAFLGAALPAMRVYPVLVNTAPGMVVTVRGRPFAVMSFTVATGKIAEINAIVDPERVRRIAAPILTVEAATAGPAVRGAG
jgi:hypothetical protein